MACATVETPIVLVEGMKEPPSIQTSSHSTGNTGSYRGTGKRSSPYRRQRNYSNNSGSNGQVKESEIATISQPSRKTSNRNNNSGIQKQGDGFKQKSSTSNNKNNKGNNGSGNGKQHNRQNRRTQNQGRRASTSSNSSVSDSVSSVRDHAAEAVAIASAAVAAATSAMSRVAKNEANKSGKKAGASSSPKVCKKVVVKDVITKKAVEELVSASSSPPVSQLSESVTSEESSESYKSQQELHERFEPRQRELPKITPRSAQSALASFFWNQSQLFQQLERAKIIGWESSELDSVFSKGVSNKPSCSRSNSMPSLGPQRMKISPVTVKPSPHKLTGENGQVNKNTAEMRFIMQAVMKELDEAVDGCLSEAIADNGTFLDVCAAPGGFSAYLQETVPDAVGMGVTLSPSKGGHAMAIPNSSKYWCRYADVLEDPSEILFCKPSHKAPYVPVEFQNIVMDGESSTNSGGFDVDRFFSSAGDTCPKPHLCDLVILDGHYLNGNNSKPILDRSTSLDLSSDILAPPACSLMNLVSKETEHATKSMWISQFIIAVQNLKQGGTLVFRSSTKPDLVQIAMLCLVARLFKGKIRAVKPTVCHMMRSSFYVVCQGFDLQMCAQLKVFPKMLFLWSQMKRKNPGSLPIWHPIDKLTEFTTPDNFINTWGPALINFFEPIWKFQALALNAMIQDCSSSSPRSPKTNGCKSKMCFYHKLGQCKRANGQCWYAHETEELHPEIRKACSVRFRPLVSPWFPPNTSKII